MADIWAPDFRNEDDDSPAQGDPVSAVYQAVGAATSPTLWGSDGVFQEQQAIAIAEGLIAYLRSHPFESPQGRGDKLNPDQHVTQVDPWHRPQTHTMPAQVGNVGVPVRASPPMHVLDETCWCSPAVDPERGTVKHR